MYYVIHMNKIGEGEISFRTYPFAHLYINKMCSSSVASPCLQKRRAEHAQVYQNMFDSILLSVFVVYTSSLLSLSVSTSFTGPPMCSLCLNVYNIAQHKRIPLIV